MKFDWKATVSAVAPAIGAVIATANPLAGVAFNALSTALLGRPDGTEDEIAAAVQGATPDQLMAIKNANQQFEKDMAALDVQDRISARDLAKTTSLIPQITLSVLYTAGYFAVLVAYITGNVQVDASIKTEVDMLLGLLAAPQVQILNFWFGSSKGSHDKTSLLQRA